MGLDACSGNVAIESDASSKLFCEISDFQKQKKINPTESKSTPVENGSNTSEHTTEQIDPTETSSTFDKRVADSLSGRMAARTFSQLADFEQGNGFTFSDVERMHRLVATRKNPGPSDYLKTSSDLICTEQLTPRAPEGGLHLTEDQLRRFIRDQIENLEPTADGPAVSEQIPISLIVDGQRKEVGATLQLSEDATGDVIIGS